MSKRGSALLVVLCAVLFTTASFAATKKSQHNLKAAADWSDLSLQNGSLSDIGSGASDWGSPLPSSDGSSGKKHIWKGPLNSPDKWNGGSGNWSLAGNWDNGVPGLNSDVTIYSGGTDVVTLDVGSTTINSLTLGGVANGFTSELTDSGSTQTLSITNGLTIGASGQLVLTGGSTVTAGADSSNAGLVDLENGSSLGITGNLTNSGTIQIGVPAGGGSTLNVSGDLSNTGFVDLENGSSLTVMGNVTNTAGGAGSGLYTSDNGSAGNNLLTINGTLDNQAGATFQLFGLGDTANVAMFTNEGNTYVAFGATLNLTNQPLGITDAVAGSDFELYGTFTAGVNPGFANLNSVEGTVNLYGQTLSINPGSGTLTIAGGGALGANFNPTNSSGTNLTINGSVDNSGLLATGLFGGEGNTLTITGDLTNEVGASFNIFGGGDKVTIGGNVTNDDIFQIITGSGPATVTINGSLANNGGLGLVDVEFGSTLTIKGDVTNSSGGFLAGIYTDLLNGVGGNTINIDGSLTNSGIFQLNGPGDLASVGNGMNNSGTVNVNGGSLLNITGDVTNSGTIQTDPGHNVIMISGMLTNEAFARFILNGPGDTATLGSLTNDSDGIVDLESGSTLTVTGDATNHALGNGGTVGIFLGYNGSENNTLNIDGTLTNSGRFALLGDFNTATLGSLDNTLNGIVVVGGIEFGDTLNVKGDVTNSGQLELGGFFGFDNKLNITGNLNNSGMFEESSSSTATIGSLSNTGSIGVGGSVLTISGDATNSGTIATGGFSTLNIGGMLTNSGTFELLGPSDMASIGNGMSNSGAIDLENGSTLKITGNVDNSGTLLTSNAAGTGGNTITITGMLTNEATGLFVLTGPSDTATIGNGMGTALANSGTVDLERGSTLTVNGNADNSNNLLTSDYGYGGGNTLNITGLLTNEAGANFQLNGPTDIANLGSLNNSGFVNVDHSSTLNVTGDVTNSGDIFTDPGVNNKINIGGELINSGTFQLNGPMDLGTIGNGVLNNVGGIINVENASTLSITGDVTNNGTLAAGVFGSGGGNTLTISGSVTNSSFFDVFFNSMATIGDGLTNSGLFDVAAGSTVTINGAVDNSGSLTTNSSAYGGGNTLAINGNLTNALSGNVTVYGPGDLLQVNGNLDNSGQLTLWFGDAGQITVNGMLTNGITGQVNLYGTGDVLQVNGNLDNFGQVATSQFGGGGNTVNVTGMLTNEATGIFTLNGPVDMASIGMGLDNSGTVSVLNGSTLQITGDASNSGNFYVSQFGSLTGGDTLKISGNLNNSGNFALYGPGDMATLGSLTNSGFADLENGSSLQVNGDVINSGNLFASNFVGTGGSSMTVTGMLNNEGTGIFIFARSDSATLGSLTNAGTADVERGSTIHVNGAVNNSGTLAADYLDFGGGDGIAIAGNLTNSGTVDIEGASTLQVNGTTNNSGILETNFHGFGGGGNTMTFNGLLTNEATGLIQLNGPGDVLKALAGLTNNGMINVNNGSSIDPPFVNNGGTINIDATSKMIVGTGMPAGLGYIQLANGTLGEIINSQNSFGVINVTGSALLAGTLDILLKAGYNPMVGTEFTILTSSPGLLSGSFANIMNDCFNGGTECWAVTYDYADGLLALTAQPGVPPVPEPATLLVLIPGLLGMGYGLRRRLSK